MVDSDVEMIEADSLISARTISPGMLDYGPCATSPKHAATLAATSQRRFLEPCTPRRAFKGIDPLLNPGDSFLCDTSEKTAVPPSFSFSFVCEPGDQPSLCPTKPRYPDNYTGPGPTNEITGQLKSLLRDPHTPERIIYTAHQMDDSRGNGHYGGGGRKRRFNRDDDREDRPARRNRYEEPVASRLRREILVIAESSRNVSEDASQLGKRMADNFDDDQVRGPFLDNMIQLLVEQPFKIPFVAAVILYANDTNADVAKEVLARVAAYAQRLMEDGTWREFKLLMRFFACLQGLFEGDGVFPVLDELFNRAADQQTASPEDVLGLELVKIILLTLPYTMASSATGLEDKARELLEQTEIIASVQHPLESLAEPFIGDDDEKPFGYQSSLELLQKQLLRESEEGWKLSCIPRVYVPAKTEENGDETMEGAENESKPKAKHAFPQLIVPSQVNPGPRAMFPEAYFSMYAEHEVETVPRTNDIAASILRDAIVDTINILDYSRLSLAKFLIDLDCYFAPGTFIKRATPFDRVREIADGKSTWKPEDLIVDAVFSQMLFLPTPEHKLVYYHSVITESCKVAPAAIAPTLGRGIRFLYKNLEFMDMELMYRFVDWFSHHVSNFDFRWKWTEWTDDVDNPIVNPKKAFIIGVIDKEIRLSFAKRIRETLPTEYHKLILEGKFKDQPDFKYASEQTPYAVEGREILAMIRKKAPETDIQVVMDAIHEQAAAHGIEDPLVPSTDAYMTSVCFIGSKSLSHVLSCIERCKGRLLAIGPQSEAARLQIIQSVVSYWKDQAGTAVNIVDKLLNYTIVTPESVIQWALGQQSLGNGVPLAQDWRFELVAATVGKVTNRVRQIVAARVGALKAGMPSEQIGPLEETLIKERDGMRALFALIDDAVSSYATGSADAFIEGADGLTDDDLDAIKSWGRRWATTFRRKAAVEEAVVGEVAVAATLANAQIDFVREEARRKAEKLREEEEQRKREEERQKRLAAEVAEAEKAEKAAISAANGAANGGAELDVADMDDVQ